MSDFAAKEFELVACKWEGHLRCIYLNDHRIAGEKPWGGGTTMKAWKVRGQDLLNAIPELRLALASPSTQTNGEMK